MLSIHLGRALFYSFASLILIYFIIYFLNNVKNEWMAIRKIAFNLRHITFSFFMIFIVMTMSNIVNDISNIHAWNYELKFLLKIPFFLLILLFFYEKKFFSTQLIYLFLVFGIVFQGLDGLYQSLNGYDFYRGTQRTLCQGLTGTTTNRNYFGFLVGFGLFAFMQLFSIHKGLIGKTLYFLIGSIFFFCVLYSLSRGVWVAVLISLSFLFLYSIFTCKYRNSFFVLAVLLILLGSIFTLDCLASRSVAVLEGSSSSRYPIWKDVTDLILQKPVLGWGMEKMNTYANYNTHAHNVLIEITLHTGFLGLSTFIFCLYLLIKDMLLNKQIFLFSILLYVIVRCFFDHTFFSGHLIPITMVVILFLTCSKTLKEGRSLQTLNLDLDLSLGGQLKTSNSKTVFFTQKPKAREER